MKNRLILLSLALFYLSGCSTTDNEVTVQNLLVNETKSDVFKLHLVNIRMEKHPTKQGYVNIIMQMMNKDKVSHKYPPLEVLFTDKLGETIAKKIFNSDELLYLKNSGTLKPLESQSIILTFEKLPKEAIEYKVSVIEKKRNGWLYYK